MSRPVVRPAIAALLLAGVAAPAVAQSGAGAGTGSGAGRANDSIYFRIIIPSRVVLDSMAVLKRALFEEPFDSPNLIVISAKIDSLVAMLAGTRVIGPGMRSGSVIAAGGGNRGAAVRRVDLPSGWIGINLQGLKHESVNGDMVQYLDYPSVISVEPASPAQRAGVAPGDVVLAYDGVDLRSNRLNLSNVLRPEHPIMVTVRRDGETKDFPMVVARTPDEIARRRRDEAAMADVMIAKSMAARSAERAGVPFVVASNGLFGMTLTNVSPDLARVLKLESGVLVTDAPEASPGYKAGLRTGDVIVAVEGDGAPTLGMLRQAVLMRSTDRAVQLQVVRDKKTRKFTVSW